MKPNLGLITALTKPLMYIMAGLVVVCGTVFVYLYLRGVEKESLDMEIAKVALQVGFVAVSGALLSVLVSNRQQELDEAQKIHEEAEAERIRKEDQEREDRRYREDLLKATLNRVTSSYNNAKRARRNMRALGLDRSAKPVLVHLKRWDECMVCVNDAQLEFEAVIIDVQTNSKSYPSFPKFLTRLTDMQEYLGRLIREYEEFRPLRGPEPTEFPLGDLKELSDFLGEVKQSLFKEEFAGGHAEARSAIRADLDALTSKSR